MQNSRWRRIDDNPPPIVSEEGVPIVILAWHDMQGAMVMDAQNAIDNEFVKHWMDVDDDAWIRSRERLPRAVDADVYGCVIAKDRHGELKNAGWHRFSRENTLEYWQSPPEMPADAGEIQEG